MNPRQAPSHGGGDGYKFPAPAGAAEFDMKTSGRLLPSLSALLLLIGAGCSPKPDLGGTWRAQMDGDNSLTLNRDGTAFVLIDMEAGLAGHIRGTSRGTWK